jgi:RNase P/RNase MRP subunit p29
MRSRKSNDKEPQMKTKIAILLVAIAAFAVPTGIANAKAGNPDDASAAARSAGEVRIKGRVTQKTAQFVVVRNGARSVKFFRRATPSLAGINVGTRVEAEGRRIGGRLTLTSIHREG